MIIDAGKENIPAVIDEISSNIDTDYNIAVVIPCLNEPDIIDLLKNLEDNNSTLNKVIVIIIINSSINATSEIIQNNLYTYNKILFYHSQNFKINFLPINIINIPEKIAGAGFARKIGMNIASTFFNKNNKDGIIISLDADCKVEKNYLFEIENTFLKNNDISIGIIYFEHPIEGNEFPENIYKATTLYELHLRYHIEKLKYINFPYPYHTIGSCFAIKSSIYQKSGGMNTRKAGEDFYFLHKIFPLGKVVEINTTCVYPSPRISNRVPFGTGPTIKNIIKNKLNYTTYNPYSYEDLKKFFDSIDLLYKNQIDFVVKNLNECLRNFLISNNFDKKIHEIKSNTSNFASFKKRFFNWFNAFKIIKYLNYVHNNNYYNKIDIIEAILSIIKKNKNHGLVNDPVILLKYLREIQRRQNITFQ